MKVTLGANRIIKIRDFQCTILQKKGDQTITSTLCRFCFVLPSSTCKCFRFKCFFSFALFGSSYKGHYSEYKMGFVIPKVKKDSTFRIFTKVRYSEFPKGSNIPNSGKGLIFQNGIPCPLFRNLFFAGFVL